MQRASDSLNAWENKFLWSFSVLMMVAIATLFLGALSSIMAISPFVYYVMFAVFSIITVITLLATCSTGLGWVATKLKNN